MFKRTISQPRKSPLYICTSCRRQILRQQRHFVRQPVPTRVGDTLISPAGNNSRRTITTTAESPTTTSPFSSHNLTLPPTPSQLVYASKFFTRPPAPPRLLLSADKFLRLPHSNIAEVAFLGRSNVGKSSLLNALVNREGVKLAHVSGKPGRTRTLNAFAVGGGVRTVKQAIGGSWSKGKELEAQKATTVEKWVRDTSVKGTGGTLGSLVVLDMPGYGKASREEWGKEIIKYVGRREQLRRTFVLIDAEHGLKSNDLQLLTLLRSEGIVHQLVATKVDKILFPKNKVNQDQLAKHLPDLEAMFDRIRKQLRDSEQEHGRSLGPPALDDIIACSSEVSWPVTSNSKIGMDAVRWAVLQAVGLECDETGNIRTADFDILPDELYSSNGNSLTNAHS